LGIEVEEEQEPAGKLIAEHLIRNLGESSLTEKQNELLEEAKEYFEQGEYSSALLKALEASQTK